jgi:tRNA dimethylallyltransferase
MTNQIDQTELPPAICLLGPTGTGKTALAMKLVQEYPFEIISVDSALVYRGFDIGSGKPSRAQLALVPHHLLDIRDPNDPYSASDFRQDAIALLHDINSQGKIPLLVGGTMLYFKALRDGLAVMPAASATVRQALIDEAGQVGWEALHKRLEKLDPVAAIRIHPNDPQRLQRALEVWELTGSTLTELHTTQLAKQGPALPNKLHFFGLVPNERARLHEVISERFLLMLQTGLINEVCQLRQRFPLTSSLPAIRSVGYRQVWDYLEGAYDYSTLVEKGIAATRQLAKRQLTWMRSWPELELLPISLCSKDEFFLPPALKAIIEAATK